MCVGRSACRVPIERGRYAQLLDQLFWSSPVGPALPVRVTLPQKSLVLGFETFFFFSPGRV